MSDNILVKSRERVSNHGEVFTAKREVNAMLDLVKQETLRIDSRFLEPACGTGNFLVEVLNRKLSVVKNHYSKNQNEYEQNSILAISSIYGIDLLHDNIEECQDRLFKVFDEQYTKLFKDNCREECRKSVHYILSQNIAQGDALTLMSGEKPIVFPEWSFVNSTMIKRKDYSFDDLLKQETINDLPLFSDLGEDVFIPHPVNDYPLTHFLKLAKNV